MYLCIEINTKAGGNSYNTAKIIMENLSYQIKNEKVVFKFILNTISNYSVCEFVSQKSIDCILETAASHNIVVSEITEGNDWFYLEQIVIYNEEKQPLLTFDLNKGKRLRPEEKIAVLEEIKLSIKNGLQEFTTLNPFEIRMHDLDYIEYSYMIDELEITHLYIFQIFQNRYQRF